jgi:hypothetical protein
MEFAYQREDDKSVDSIYKALERADGKNCFEDEHCLFAL